ncbi:MAG: cell division protein SepF [Apilactobacillus sp.]|uniref:cell division protein SepF n=1 Tax=Apilactobacillus apinorum TaxID=1218495 RepID=UPI0030E821C0|nr:cell division protein SepF [Apilactobacillus sp.]
MSAKFSISKFFGTDYDQDEEYYDNEPQVETSDKVVSIGKNRGHESSKIAVFEPKIYADVKTIAQKLIDNNAVIINFDAASDEATRRIIDFLNGVIFTIDGNIERISELVFLFTPHNYSVDGDIRKEMNDRLR